MSPWFYSHVKTLVVAALTVSALFFVPTLSIAAQATLAWDPNDPVPEGYRIYQRTEGQAYDYSQPSWEGADNTGTVEALADDTTYYFVVRAFDGAAESADSNEVSFSSPSPVLPTYTIAASSGDHGGISPEGTVSVDENGSQTFIVSPDAGYHVADVIVDGNSTGAATAYTFNQVAANHSISAVFAVDTYTITASAGANGSISPAGITRVDHGGSQSYAITPDAGYHVADVKVDGISKGSLSSYTFAQVTGNRSIEASFSKDTYTVPQSAEATLAWDPNDPTPDGYRIYQRTEGQAYDYSQPVWTGSGTTGTVYNLDYDTTYYFVVRAYAGGQESADSNEVSFSASSPVPATHTIQVVAGSNGVVSPCDTVTVTSGSDQAFSISPDAGCHVGDVTVDGVSVGAVQAYTFNQVSADHTLTVTFAVDTHTLSASAGTHGSISPAGVVSVIDGSSKTYTMTPDAGYQVADVLVDGASQGAVTTYTFDSVTTDHTITATFTAVTYSVTATSGVNGAITPAGSASVVHGGSLSYAITANAGYHVSDVRVDGVSVGAVGAYTFANVTASHTISAAFEADTNTLTLAAGPNGSISPAGMVPVAYGGSQTVTFTADTGFHVEDVLVDGQSVGGVDQYTFTNVQGDHTLTVTFAENNLVKMWIEAEDGDLQWPMEIGDDISAAAGGFTWVPAGSVNTADASESAGYAEYQVEIPETGDYVIWGRQISSDSASDSFFISMDGQAEMVWHTKIGGQDTWTWDVVSDRAVDDARDATNPLRFRLEAGIHTLTVKQREAGTRLDTIVITNDLNMGVSELDSALLAPVIEVEEFDPCISELDTATIAVAVSDPEGGNLTYAWELPDGGTLSGSGNRVTFTPESIGPHPCPYRVNLVVTSDADLLPGKASFEIVVRLAGDVNGDGSVNVQDKLLVRRARGLTGEPGWIPEDVNRDGLVNISDVLVVRSQTGQSGCACP